jgi:hypothetical protein
MPLFSLLAAIVPPIKAIMIIFLNELDNHSHFDNIKHSKGYISEAEND